MVLMDAFTKFNCYASDEDVAVGGDGKAPRGRFQHARVSTAADFNKSLASTGKLFVNILAEQGSYTQGEWSGGENSHHTVRRTGDKRNGGMRIALG